MRLSDVEVADARQCAAIVELGGQFAGQRFLAQVAAGRRAGDCRFVEGRGVVEASLYGGRFGAHQIEQVPIVHRRLLRRRTQARREIGDQAVNPRVGEGGVEAPRGEQREQFVGEKKRQDEA
ncbi:hypothetical protein, partial [Candidatus Accumulibacter vicinus]|uniref:hypothetical protein n=1 Tax=Candidatus Accumulibacter vicinus TaxID=2954382 RepID=UPI00235B6AD4